MLSVFCQTPMETGEPSVSSVAKTAAEKLAPGLKAEAIANQGAVLGAIGNPMFRMAAKKAYPFIVDQIPTTTGIVCDRFLSTMGNLTVTELVALVKEHAAQKGETVSEDLRKYLTPLRNPVHGSKGTTEVDEANRPG